MKRLLSERILSGYKAKEIVEAANDLLLVFSLYMNLQNNYLDQREPRKKNLDNFIMLIERWNEKYPLLKLIFKETDLGYRLDIEIRDTPDSVIDIITRMNSFEKIESGQEISAVFSGNNTLSIRKMQLLYPRADMIDTNSPEFRLCIYYALKYYNSINLQDYSDLFIFTGSVPSHKLGNLREQAGLRMY